MFSSAVMLWVVPAAAADLAVTACLPDASGARSIASGKKALTVGRPLLVRRSSVQYERSTSAKGDRVGGDKKYSDVWYRRQFVLVVGVAY
jgi:hypothetical protein